MQFRDQKCTYRALLSYDSLIYFLQLESLLGIQCTCLTAPALLKNIGLLRFDLYDPEKEINDFNIFKKYLPLFRL